MDARLYLDSRLVSLLPPLAFVIDDIVLHFLDWLEWRLITKDFYNSSYGHEQAYLPTNGSVSSLSTPVEKNCDRWACYERFQLAVGVSSRTF